MNLSLNSKTNELIQEKVASGRYASAEEVIEEAMQLLEARDQEGEEIKEELEGREEEIRQKIAEGIKAMEEGRYITVTSENREEVIEGIKRRGKEHLKKEQIKRSA